MKICPTAIHKDCQRAEEYLFKVLNRSAKCRKFDELQFHHKNYQIEEFITTSNSIKPHIKRAVSVVHGRINCLDRSIIYLNLETYGWQLEDILVPKKIPDAACR